MRKYNKKLNTDITELKNLHSKKDKTEFNKMKAEVMKQHNISKATVYREMKKDNPGSYKSPRYDPPIREITEKEKELVSGKLFKQMPIEQLRLEMEKQTGESYSWDRIDKIRSVIEEEYKYKPIAVSKKKQKEVESNESSHGEDIKFVLEKLLNIDKIEPNNIVTINMKGMQVKLGADAITDIMIYISNSAAGKGRNVVEVMEINLKHLLAESVRRFSDGSVYSIRDLREVYAMYHKISGTGISNTIDFDLLVAVVQKFAPNTDRVDIMFETSELSEQFKGCSKEIEPDLEEMRPYVLKAMKDKM